MRLSNVSDESALPIEAYTEFRRRFECEAAKGFRSLCICLDS